MKSIPMPSACIKTVVAIIFSLLVLPHNMHAQPVELSGPTQLAEDDSAKELKVTWQDIIKLVDAHPSIADGKQRVTAALAGIEAAGAIPNPEIEASTAHGEERDGSASRVVWGIELSIPLGWIAQRGVKIDVAEAEARVVKAESELLRRDVLFKLRSLFWSLVYQQELVKALVELNQETATLMNTVRRRVEKGESRPVETIRVEIEAEKIAGELATAESILKTRRVQVGFWLDAGKDKIITAVADLAKLPRPISRSDARAKIISSHPAVIAGQSRVQALSANVALERRNRVPDLSVRAFTDHELDHTAYGVGLVMKLPVWNFNTGSIRQAEAALAAKQNQLDAERIELESAVVESQLACQASVQLAARYLNEIQPRAILAAQTTERIYQLGEATLLDVIDARRTLLETQTELLSALVQAQTECSRLAIYVGEKLP